MASIGRRTDFFLRRLVFLCARSDSECDNMIKSKHEIATLLTICGKIEKFSMFFSFFCGHLKLLLDFVNDEGYLLRPNNFLKWHQTTSVCRRGSFSPK